MKSKLSPDMSLALGISSISFVTGFVVSLSETPVASSALPLIFGLVTIGVGLASSLKQSQHDSDKLQGIVEGAKTRVGYISIAFSVAFVFGIFSGYGLRINKNSLHDIFHIGHSPDRLNGYSAYPELEDKLPENVRALSAWVVLRDQYIKAGFDQTMLTATYEIFLSQNTTQTEGKLSPEIADFYKSISHSIGAIESTLDSLEQNSRSSAVASSMQPQSNDEASMTGIDKAFRALELQQSMDNHELIERKTNECIPVSTDGIINECNYGHTPPDRDGPIKFEYPWPIEFGEDGTDKLIDLYSPSGGLNTLTTPPGLNSLPMGIESGMGQLE